MMNKKQISHMILINFDEQLFGCYLVTVEQRLYQNFTIMANFTFIFDVSEFNPFSEQ